MGIVLTGKGASMNDSVEGEGPGKAIASAINQTGLPNTVRGKVQRVILRMVAGIIGPERIEKVRENVGTIEGRSRIDTLVAEEIARQAINDPAYMERAKARFLGELDRKQDNVEAVASKAQERIDAAPDADAEVADSESEPSQDWMNAFIREAENASSDDLRDRLAAILAGEARKPGTYSRATIRVVSEMEKEVLTAFQEALQYRVGDAIIRDESWNEGTWFTKAVMLENEGLISGSSGFTNRIIKINLDRNGFLIGKTLGMVVQGEPDIRRDVGVWLLTAAGEQVASLLPPNDELIPLRQVADKLDKTGLDTVFAGTVVPVGIGQARVLSQVILWTKPPADVEPVTDTVGADAPSE